MLKKSMDIINKNFLLIIILTLMQLPALISASLNLKLTLLLLPLAIGGFFVYCGVYSSLWQYNKENKYNFVEGIKKNIVNYFWATLVGVFILLIFVIPKLLLQGSMRDYQFYQTPTGLLFRYFTGLIFGILLIYVTPHVFTKGEGANAVLDGIKYLSKNLNKSALPIIIVLCFFSIAWLPRLPLTAGLATMLRVLLAILSAFISSYLACLNFLVASFILNKE
jgi:hypothetical protein